MGYGARDAVNTPVRGSGWAGEGGTGSTAQDCHAWETARIKSPTKHCNDAPPPQGLSPSTAPPPPAAIGASTGAQQPWNGSWLVYRPSSRRHWSLFSMDVQFVSGLAWPVGCRRRHRSACVAPVGGRLEVGTVWLVSTNDHPIPTPQHTPQLLVEPCDYPYRPSVDVFFQSLLQHGATHWSDKVAGVLLTGIGRDGAAGLAALRQAGWYTIAQDQASSVVYGMLKAAAEIGAAGHILPLEAMASTLVQFFKES